MTCPFLREAAVKYCQTAAFRKLIPLAAAGRADEKCASEAHAACPVFRLQNQEPISGACPYLRESLMQYCGAAPIARFVPYSESLLSRCGNDGFRYCELYLQMAHPEPAAALDISAIAAPDWLRYSANHMWLDATGDGACHVGIDAFLSRAAVVDEPGIQEIRWERPTRPGDRLHVRRLTLAARPRDSGTGEGEVEFLYEVVNQNGLVAMTQRSLLVVKRRSEARAE